VAFIVLAVLLVVLETQVSGFGAFGAGALVSFILGGLILFSQIGPVSPDIPNLTPDLSVSLWVLGSLAAFLAVSLGALIWIIQQSRKRRKGEEVSQLLGRTGRVTLELAPRGVMRIEGETWTAVSQDGNVVPVGEWVKVARVDGLTLTVSPSSDPGTDS
jgi:membrane-bound ClpP family serine protease